MSPSRGAASALSASPEVIDVTELADEEGIANAQPRAMRRTLSDDDALHHTRNPHVHVVEVLSDAEDEPAAEVVHRTAVEVQRQRIEAARAALRRDHPSKLPAEETFLSSYCCPICLGPPMNICVTPCGHVFCGRCLHETLLSQGPRDGGDRNGGDWLEALGDGAQSGYGSNLFTPFGSSGAMALANAAGVSSAPAREVFSEAVSQRRAQRAQLPSPPQPNAAAQPANVSRMRAKNGTQRMRGKCPVCRSSINGGFTGPARRGVLGLEIMLGTPVPDDVADSHKVAGNATHPRKRARVA